MVPKRKKTQGSKNTREKEKRREKSKGGRQRPEEKTVEKYCFPSPRRKRKTTSPTRNVVTEGRKALREGTNNSTA